MFNQLGSNPDCVNLVLGEPSFQTPVHIIEAAHEALMEGNTHYTHNTGIAELRRVVSESLLKERRLYYDPDTEILITAGAQEALYLSLQAILCPGDEVILTDPFFPPYENEIRLAGGEPVFVTVREEDGFVFDISDLEDAITEKTKAILLNSPANPTGSVIGDEVLNGIARITEEYDLYVISDEVYSSLLYDKRTYTSIAQLEGMKERTVLINSLSKSYAMTGWRIGYAAVNSATRLRMTHLQENVMACVSNPSQYAAIEALRGPQDFLEQMHKEYQSRREVLVEGLNRIPGISCRYPEGAFFVFANINDTGMDAEQFVWKLYEESGVLLVPGSGFGRGGEGFVRISFAASMDCLREGLRRIEAFVHSTCMHAR